MRQQEQLNNDHPETVRSTPVPVTDDDHVTDEFDGTDERGARAEAGADRNRPWDGRPGDDERAEFHDPGPVPTAFGATSVGGAVAASALANPRPENEPDPRAERTARPGDGAVDGEREGLRADPTAEFGGRHDEIDPAEVTEADDVARDAGTHRADRSDEVDEDRFDDEERAAVTDEDRSPGTDTAAAAAGGAGYGSATPAMVDPDTQSATGVAANGSSAAVPAGAATLFDDTTAQGFRDRWRDVQLRFVDDPRAAAGEAQTLVDEAMQALSTALTQHKEKLGSWQEAGATDTEQLRVAVREYRDFLDRVLGR
ncbi:hypothetical protein JMF97_14800 [Micromonospora fiedleri]|uniref:Uncharacterized protein n=1 Tax=Micromonospora fiedleri TaxID=1157498 RepID=A0ABS1UM46_9ACTN|nr:hypothetical protein [Micromonospora fiedleri]WSK42279.1 hypothetical protein OG712_28120 [Micromonospora maris]